MTKKVHAAMQDPKMFKGYRMLFGLDANVYEQDSKKTQSFLEYVDAYKKMELSSVFGDDTDPSSYATFNGRTYLQAQIQKACKSSEKRECGDVNPKDFIIFLPDHYQPLEHGKDNTGTGEYVENVPFPTLTFPSDHGVL